MDWRIDDTMRRGVQLEYLLVGMVRGLRGLPRGVCNRQRLCGELVWSGGRNGGRLGMREIPVYVDRHLPEGTMLPLGDGWYLSPNRWEELKQQLDVESSMHGD